MMQFRFGDVGHGVLLVAAAAAAWLMRYMLLFSAYTTWSLSIA